MDCAHKSGIMSSYSLKYDSHAVSPSFDQAYRRSGRYINAQRDGSGMLEGGGGGRGIHMVRDLPNIFHVNCDLHIVFYLKRDWGYIRET